MTFNAPGHETQPDNIFNIWQPRYAARGFATFPVKFNMLPDGKVDKIPLVKYWTRFGLRASTQLTRKFADAYGIGLTLGMRSGLAVADIDSRFENVLADVLAYYGPSPLIARTPSGGFHVYYRHNGCQRRRIRDPYWHERGAPVDVLGNGMVVLPASRSPKGDYRFIQGRIDDLQRLPILRAVAANKIDAASPDRRSPLRGMRQHDGRNNALFLAIGQVARDIYRERGTRGQLLEIARAHNSQCSQPMEDSEVSKIVDNVWSYTDQGRNTIGHPGLFCLTTEHLEIDDPYAFKLLAFLRAHNRAFSVFWCSNGLAELFGWDRKRLASARQVLIEEGYLVPVRRASNRHPALFKWGSY